MATVPEGDHAIKRFYLSAGVTLGPDEEPFKYEVPKEVWLVAERSAGFRGGREGEPATGGFGNGGIRGYQSTFWTTIKVRGMALCANCGVGITLVHEQFFEYAPGADDVWRTGITTRDTWRHANEEFELYLGPTECNLSVIRYEATPKES
jgi:hypothetical protein